MAMNLYITGLIGTLIISSALYYFSLDNLTLNNCKEFIERYDHKLEEYAVTTEDGYIINLWHLHPNFKVNPEKVIFLQPGFLSTGLCYFGLKENSMAYFLQEKGYDVWIGNNRGSKFSANHVSKNPKDVNGDFWEFSMDNFIQYDIPSEINFIKNKTKATKVNYVGSSEGNALFLMLYMDNPQFVESSINKFISIGTIPNLSTVPYTISEFLDTISRLFKFTEPFNKALKFSDKARTAIIKSVKNNPQTSEKLFQEIGTITNRTKADSIALFFSYYPTDTSIYHIYQWERIQKEKKFVYYNPKDEKNDKVKEYDVNVLKNWKIKTLMTRSRCDHFSQYDEVTKLYDTIQNKSLIKLFDIEYSHLDYGMAESAFNDFYIPMVNYLDEK
jgi:lysosomal acid lipase/cholesteryl ester hydrolase